MMWKNSSNLLRLIVVLVLTCGALGSLPTPAKAATVPTGFQDTNITNLSSATAMAFAPDGRLFVLQQSGAVKIVKNDVLLGTNFHTLTVDSGGERGLLGIAFHPSFASNNYLYLYYTVPGSPPHNRVSRFTANGDVVVANSELAIIDLEDLSGATNHNGGAMAFGPDGNLYVAVGENANSANAQSFSNRLGKMLRYNADGTIPTDNPFYGTATGQNRSIWALGLRNPFTFAFQPGTGKMHINDVGQSTWEEVNVGLAGANYGWPTTEGPTTNPSFKSPFYWYNHSNGSPTGCAITGGTFYNPTAAQFPSAYVGKYFFADYCGNWIYRVDPSATGNPPTVVEFATSVSAPVDLDVSADGALYYLRRGGLGKITYPSGQVVPSIVQHPQNRIVTVGQTAQFTVSAQGTPPLNYQWQKNNIDISGATSASYTTPATVIGDNGATFRAIVSNAFGSATSNSATLTVTQRQPPTVQITSPITHTLYNGGQVFNYAGTGTDAVDGTLPASIFSWTMVLHHDSHTHPFLGPITGVKNGSFTIPATGHTETSIWYRVNLTVTNTAGLSSSTYIDLDPRLVNLTLQSNPPGLRLTLDGQPATAPISAQSVVGVARNLGASGAQLKDGRTYVFSAWSDSGAVTHDVSTPNTNTTFTATFVQSYRPDTIGVYQNGAFYLRNSNTQGPGEIVFPFGEAGWYPVAGDWNGDAVDTVGLVNPATSVFYLRNTNSTGPANSVFTFGNPGDLPIAGRWDSSMAYDGVGVYRISNGILYLKKTFTTGFADYAMILGNPADLPVAGDWDKNGYDSVGVLRSSSQTFYLSNLATNGVIFADLSLVLTGANTAVNPIAGDWTGNGFSRVGFRNSTTVGLRMSVTSGVPDVTFAYGSSGARPIAGKWAAITAPPPLLVAPGGNAGQLATPVYTEGGTGTLD